MNMTLFPFDQYWWFYLAFAAFVVLVLLLDLGAFRKESRRVGLKEAATWTVGWTVVALTFNYLLYLYAQWTLPLDPRLAGADHHQLARQVALEFLAGFVVEKSLAIDNIFLFVVVFGFLSLPLERQHRVLVYGVLGAVVFRAIFIALGAVLIEHQWVVLLFGAFLILTGVKLFFAPKREPDPSKNVVLRLLTRSLPVCTDGNSDRFFLRREGKFFVTPMFLALVLIELSDIIFAVDSVPAIFALTREPLIVFTSNIFAILGLRSMYFLLAGVYDKFHLLKYGLGLVLVFVGLKMVWLNDLFDGKFPVSWSLLIITVVIGASTVLSLRFPLKQHAARLS
ncbi:MAG: TerC/Alx family metal homeostasis membrane protein [Bdellovibrionota bacterium]